jgi:hypothetical protein
MCCGLRDRWVRGRRRRRPSRRLVSGRPCKAARRRSAGALPRPRPPGAPPPPGAPGPPAATRPQTTAPVAPGPAARAGWRGCPREHRPAGPAPRPSPRASPGAPTPTPGARPAAGRAAGLGWGQPATARLRSPSRDRARGDLQAPARGPQDLHTPWVWRPGPRARSGAAAPPRRRRGSPDGAPPTREGALSSRAPSPNASPPPDPGGDRARPTGGARPSGPMGPATRGGHRRVHGSSAGARPSCTSSVAETRPPWLKPLKL